MSKRRKRITVAVSLLVLAALAGWSLWRLHIVYNETLALTYLREIGGGFEQFASDHDGRLPSMTSSALLERQLDDYGSEMSIASIHPLLVVPNTDIPYLLNPALEGKKMSAIPEDEEDVLLYQARPYDGKRAVLLLAERGAFARFIREAQWQQRTHGGTVLRFRDTSPQAVYPINKA